jgi:hypothetical protein
MAWRVAGEVVSGPGVSRIGSFPVITQPPWSEEQLILINVGLHIIGELCHLLEFDRMVTALSRKSVILAVPVQARHGSAEVVGLL